MMSKAHIITVSEFSKSEILRVYKIKPGRISIIQNGWQHIQDIAPDEAIIDRYELSRGGYYFAMATAAPNKNVKWIIDPFDYEHTSVRTFLTNQAYEMTY